MSPDNDVVTNNRRVIFTIPGQQRMKLRQTELSAEGWPKINIVPLIVSGGIYVPIYVQDNFSHIKI